MGKIAFIIGEQFVYWSPLILLAACVAAAFVFLSLHLLGGGKLLRGILIVVIAVVPCVVLGRLIYWYCRPDAFASFSRALSGFDSSGCALAGVFAGCLLAACLARGFGLTDSLPHCLDAMSLAGGVGISVGRLNHLFNSFDRGQVVESVRAFPLVYPVENNVTGAPEYRLATFMLQAMATAVITVVLVAVYLRGKKTGKLPGGDVCLLFLLCYGACQIFFDSTRYDSLFLRSNGFVSMVQILGLVGVLVAVVLPSIRMVKNRGFRWWQLALWGGVLALLTTVGIMEYFVQRRANDAAFFYSFMVAALLGVIVLGVTIHQLSLNRKK